MNNHKLFIIVGFMCMSILLAACGQQNYVVPEPTKTETSSVVRVEKKTIACETQGDMEEISDDELTNHVICLIKNDLHDKANEVILSQNKQEDKVFSVLLNCASAFLNRSTTLDEWFSVSDKILEIQAESESQQFKEEMANLILKIHKSRTQPLLDKEKQEFNEKYYNPSIGMTKEEVEKSEWGTPSDINKTTTKYGVSEQWVYYGGKYIYFEDGLVTSISE